MKHKKKRKLIGWFKWEVEKEGREGGKKNFGLSGKLGRKEGREEGRKELF